MGTNDLSFQTTQDTLIFENLQVCLCVSKPTHHQPTIIAILQFRVLNTYLEPIKVLLLPIVQAIVTLKHLIDLPSFTVIVKKGVVVVILLLLLLHLARLSCRLYGC